MNVLITGASGYIGQYLVKILEGSGHNVMQLSRKHRLMENYYSWNIEKGTIDIQAIEKTDAIIHLAGENIGSGRWTAKRKKEIINSRKLGTKLLIDTINKSQNKPKIFISASATGIYGAKTVDTIFDENSEAASDFLGTTTQSWEEESKKASSLNIRTVIIRTGVVFSKNSKALQKMMMPIRFGFGSDLGTGKQYIPWIHLHDLALIYKFALENEIDGVFNAVAPEHITQHSINEKIAKIVRRPIFLPPVPEYILKLFLGEMAVIITRGSRVSSEKIRSMGFEFEAKTFDEMLKSSI